MHKAAAAFFFPRMLINSRGSKSFLIRLAVTLLPYLAIHSSFSSHLYFVASTFSSLLLALVLSLRLSFFFHVYPLNIEESLFF